MVLTKEIEKQIIEYVKKEPRTIQDIAQLINKSWITADSYVEEIKERTGLINIKKFRGGTKGSVKIIYWNYNELAQSSDIMKNLFEQIKTGRVKTDFNPFDIYQFVDEGKKSAIKEEYTDDFISTKQNLIEIFRKAKDTIYCFSGNISWLKIEENGIMVEDVVKELADKGVKFKILCRVDFNTIKNIDMIKDVPNIEIKHCRHPLRGFIIDDELLRLKGFEEKNKYKEGELDKDVRVFYNIYDRTWVEWGQKVFWNLHRNSIPADKRIKEIEAIF
ncbi:MAG: hypothetical protein PHW96_00235 [Candidatus Nanoarchaeia archaeon]|nr:hypothetical protein [Candidatus Nanoarchaeia archaeon]